MTFYRFTFAAIAALALVIGGCPEETTTAATSDGAGADASAEVSGDSGGTQDGVATDEGSPDASPDVTTDAATPDADASPADVPAPDVPASDAVADASSDAVADGEGDGSTSDAVTGDASADGSLSDADAATSDGSSGDSSVGDASADGTEADTEADAAEDAAEDAEPDVPACAEGTPCDDGLPGTKDDACDATGACVGTVYTCAPLQCEMTATPNGVDCDVTFNVQGTTCDDGDPATSDDECDGAGVCAGTQIACNPTQCQETSVPNGTDCDVTFKASGEACDDGDNATNNDQCDGAGGCVGTPYTCTPGTCEDSSTPNGIDCDITFTVANTACDDGSVDTNNDVCDGAGSCVGTPYTCSPGVCEDASVTNGVDCTVTFTASGTGCDDGDLTTNNDQCNGNGACAGTPYTCAPGQCELTSTHNGVDCDVTYASSGTGCNDNNNSTRDDVCDGDGGCAGDPYTCPFPTLCQASVTPNGVDCTIVNQPNGTNCDDGETCTTPDTCQEGVCVGTSLCGNGTCDAICGENAGTCQADCLTTVGQCNAAAGENACNDWQDCHSNTTGSGLCANIGCGTGQVGNCFCDPQCIQYGDCCQDMQAVCGCP